MAEICLGSSVYFVHKSGIDAKSGIDNMVVQAKLKIVDVCIQILKRENKGIVKACSANGKETRQDRN